MLDAPEPKAPSDELVVDQDQWPFFQNELTTMSVFSEHDDSDDTDDGLGLVRLRKLKDSAQTLVDLDDLMAELRRRFEAQYPGVGAQLGKNRYVESLVGSGNKIMDGDVPTVPEVESVPESAPPLEAGRGVRIGMVDTPITVAAAKRLGVQTDWSFAEGGGIPIPFRAGHSTFVASLIKRQAPGAELFLEGIAKRKTGRANSWDTARAMMRLVNDHHIDILNLSIGCYASTGPPFVVRRAIEKLSERVLVVAAAGNHGGLPEWFRGRTRDSGFWPAAIPPVIAVGADNGEGGSPPLWSPQLPWITCTALGVDIVADYINGPVKIAKGDVRTFDGTAKWSGTSFAAATVSGAIAAQMVNEQAAAQGLAPHLTPRDAFDDLVGAGTLVRKFEPGG